MSESVSQSVAESVGQRVSGWVSMSCVCVVSGSPAHSLTNNSLMLQISISLVDKKEVEERDRESKEESKEEQPQKKRKRTKFSDSVSARKLYRSTGARRVLVLAMFPKIGEGYDSIRDILEKMRFEAVREQRGLHTKVSADLKVILVLVGQQSIGSTYNCPYCLKPRRSFRVLRLYELRTFAGNYYWYCVFVEIFNGDKQFAKDCYNCVRAPMSIFPGSGKIVNEIPPPELHLFIGFFNDLYDMVLKFDEILSEEWTDYSHAVREEYFGGTFEGNESRRLLNRTDTLKLKVLAQKEREERENKDSSRLGKILEVTEVLEAFKMVVVSCFGWRLDGGYETAIRNLREKYLSLSWKPSIHSENACGL